MLAGIAKLTSATLVSQVIAFLSLPILTRLYTTEQFGIYSMYLHVTSILLLGTTLHYDVAIQAPEKDEDGVSLAVSAMALVTVMCAMITIFVFFAGPVVLPALDLSSLVPYSLIFPIGLFGFGIFNILSNYALRNRAYGLIAKTNVMQSVAQSLIQLSMSFTGAWGLLAGDVANRSAGLTQLFGRIFFRDLRRHGFSLGRAKTLLWEFRTYPIFGMTSGILITVGVSLPPILIGQIWGLKNLGLFMLAVKILDIPKALIGRSISRVYLAESMKMYNEAPGKLHGLFLKTSLATLAFSLGSVIPLAAGFYFFGGWLFGPKWSAAGWVGVYLVPSTMAALIVAPISQIATVARKLHIELGVSVVRVAFVVVLFYFLKAYEVKFESAVLWYSSGAAGVYLLYYVVYFAISRQVGSQQLGGRSDD